MSDPVANMTTRLGSSEPARVMLRSLSKSFGPVSAVKALSMTVEPGEFVSLLGQSGCGKTTTLRMVAGLERPDSGVLEIGDKSVTRLPAYRRNIGMVFQNMALFPHMDVAANVAFGLRMKKIPKREWSHRVAEALKTVALGGMERRMPSQLSGGQQQRVALARAIVTKPRVLLLDEPLAALDANLREELRVEIRHIQQLLGITAILVTHDQEEAISVSDRIAVMNDGHIEQYSTPRDIYERPESVYVASFIGQNNLLKARRVGRTSSEHVVELAGGQQILCHDLRGDDKDDSLCVVLKRERLSVAPAEKADGRQGAHLSGVVERVTYVGMSVRYDCRVSGQTLIALVPSREAANLRPGENVTMSWQPEDCFAIVDSHGGENSGYVD